MVNSYFGKNFPSLLNEYRVREAIRMLSDRSYHKYKLEEIGEISGYKNRQVFYCVFKKMTGVVPSDFRKMYNNKDFEDNN